MVNRQDELLDAYLNCKKARSQMNTAKNKGAWREAEEELNFWQGKASYLERMIFHQKPGKGK